MPPRRNLKPRRETQNSENLNLKHHLFAIAFLDCLNPGEAYVRAGYEVKSEEVAQAAGRRLLRNVRVMAMIDNAKREMAEEAKATAANTVARLNLVYLEAMLRSDFANAISALRELGKHFGIYEKDNTQKSYTLEDAERLRKSLEARGVSFVNRNKPSEN